MGEVASIIGEFSSSSDVEGQNERHERLVRGLSRVCTEVFFRVTYGADDRGRPIRLLGASRQFIYPPQGVSQSAESYDATESVPIQGDYVETMRHDYDASRVTGILEVNLDASGDNVYFGVNSVLGKSEFPEKVTDAINSAISRNNSES